MDKTDPDQTYHFCLKNGRQTIFMIRGANHLITYFLRS